MHSAEPRPINFNLYTIPGWQRNFGRRRGVSVRSMALWLRWGIFGSKTPYSATPDIGVGSDKATVATGKFCHAEGSRKDRFAERGDKGGTRWPSPRASGSLSRRSAAAKAGTRRGAKPGNRGGPTLGERCAYGNGRAADPPTRTYWSWVMLAKVVFSWVPRPATTVIMATAMPAAMRPYSIAVAADWSFTNRKVRERIGGPLG